LILLSVCFAAVGCGNGGRAPVEGTVTLDGKNVDGGTIVFAPEDFRDGTPIVKAEIKNGKYSLDASNGPVVGKYRVEISWMQKTGRQIPANDNPEIKVDEEVQRIPIPYNSGSKNMVEIKSGGNKFDYTITSTVDDVPQKGKKPGTVTAN
jgi:hypothetical protein